MKDILDIVFKRYDINTPLRRAYFMAHAEHESLGFTKFVENLNYKAEALLALFSRDRIAEQACIVYGRTAEHAANQMAIANTVYGGVWGKKNLGNIVPGDGWKHRGAGAIQLTGRANQEAYFKSIGEPCDPDKLQQLKYALDSAGWFWKAKGLNAIADRGDFKASCIKVNGGLVGYNKREALLIKYKKEYVATDKNRS